MRRSAMHHVWGGLALAGVAAALAGVTVQPAAAAPIRWLTVQLGAHRFGQLRSPDAIVARAGVHDVGFSDPANGGQGCGDDIPHGPRLFDVGRDGSIWVLDEINQRLLRWTRGRPARPVDSIALPKGLGFRDFTVGSNGTIYVAAIDLEGGQTNLYALTATGAVRWQEPIAGGSGNVLLRIGPDGRLYTTPQSPGGRAAMWMPLTTPFGRPLSVAQQRHGRRRSQPVGRGLQLISSQRSAHEVRFALLDRTGRVVRAWRVTSRSPLGFMRVAPALVGEDLVVSLDVTREAKKTFLWEHLVLRLAPEGGIQRQAALKAGALWGDDGSGTPLRIGSDGRLYQLRTDPKTGMTVARYSLGRTTSLGRR